MANKIFGFRQCTAISTTSHVFWDQHTALFKPLFVFGRWPMFDFGHAQLFLAWSPIQLHKSVIRWNFTTLAVDTTGNGKVFALHTVVLWQGQDINLTYTCKFLFRPCLTYHLPLMIIITSSTFSFGQNRHVVLAGHRVSAPSTSLSDISPPHSNGVSSAKADRAVPT